MFRSSQIIIREICSLLNLYYSIHNSIRHCTDNNALHLSALLTVSELLRKIMDLAIFIYVNDEQQDLAFISSGV